MPIFLRIAALIGRRCIPSPFDMKAEVTSSPSIVATTLTARPVPKKSNELGNVMTAQVEAGPMSPWIVAVKV